MATENRENKGRGNNPQVSGSITGQSKDDRIKMMRLLGDRQDNDERKYPRTPKLIVVDYSDQKRIFRDFGSGSFLVILCNFPESFQLIRI